MTQKSKTFAARYKLSARGAGLWKKNSRARARVQVPHRDAGHVEASAGRSLYNQSSQAVSTRSS